MNRIAKLLLLAFAAPTFAQMPQITVKVEKKESAQAQLEYARKLSWKLASAKTPHDVHVAVANAASNFMAVERGWPNNRAAIVEANALLAELYLDGKMPQNAIEAGERGLTLAPNDYRLHFAIGRAHDRLGNQPEALSAYRKAIETYRPGRQDEMESLAGLNAAAFFFEKQKLHAEAAAAARHAAALPGNSPMIRLVLLVKTVELSSQTPDHEAIRRDIAALREAHRVAMAQSPTPGGLEDAEDGGEHDRAGRAGALESAEVALATVGGTSWDRTFLAVESPLSIPR
jgi:tetratricopeptide (TPR) repeat protein